ncbi:S8 family serine peptidase [Kitasatospora purpeofusca]|uniref:S8 family serine peptidase n=1 Tax=Kitasatospora purpeofusca TaxID=67352 RepID=UPI00224CF993|nr:S8 family serine peptidase [Kitasatospora purpeofusca]MCX4757746.1 S8 family serine peptidase [Kitasatospora purpeofusca]WSR34554.1 S8 family serine peptidase [Kitasatospora purpeofusca]
MAQADPSGRGGPLPAPGAGPLAVPVRAVGPGRPVRRRGRVPLRVLLAMLLTALVVGGAVPYVAGPGRSYLSYLVLAERADADGAAHAAAEARAAGGQVVQEYPQIGMVLAYAGGGFAEKVRGRPGVAAVGASRTSPVPGPPRPLDGAGDFRAGADPAAGDRAAGDRVPPGRAADGNGVRGGVGGGNRGGDGGDDATATVPDPGEQDAWNLALLGAAPAAGDATPNLLRGTRAPAADALRKVLVAVLDSGVDDTHPDLRAAVDPRSSASCADGRPDARTGAWRPDAGVGESGHGTHVAGIVGAARDGRGVSGVAPGVRIAAVRLLGPLGQYYAENIVCGMLWAADHGARAINNSYFADPWKYNCPEDPDQAALTAAVGRAVEYARGKGAVVVASAGNDAQDLGAPRTDERSPNDRTTGPPQSRHVGPECVRLPGELPGVVTVTAVDRDGRPSAYTNYGRGHVSLAAPGGDPDGGARGAVVSDWPGGRYAALAGTSMAAAHVTGAVAVAAALHPDWGSDRLAALLAADAAAACPPGPHVCGDHEFYGAGTLVLPH